jgi:hypothetical protein
MWREIYCLYFCWCVGNGLSLAVWRMNALSIRHF